MGKKVKRGSFKVAIRYKEKPDKSEPLTGELPASLYVIGIKEPEKLRDSIESHSNGGLYLVHESMALDKLAYHDMESLIYEIQKRLHGKN